MPFELANTSSPKNPRINKMGTEFVDFWGRCRRGWFVAGS
jgi:hypothetical protein